MASYPDGTRLIVRRERPHPGAHLDLFDTSEGFRHQVVATDTGHGGGSIQYLEVRHRAHARVEDRIRTGKDTGFGRFPSRQFAINAAWLELSLTGIDLLAWTRTMLLDGELAAAEPKKLRYRLLHVPARITRIGRSADPQPNRPSTRDKGEPRPYAGTRRAHLPAFGLTHQAQGQIC